MRPGAWPRRTLPVVTLAVLALPVSAQQAPAPAAPVAAAGRSLLVPGWGQLSLGQKRGWAYLAAEAVLWGVWLERRGAGADLRRAYRDVAWEEARLQAGERVDGDWTYYETLSKWARSGAYDRDPAASGLQPEPDAGTFNGSIWALARGIYLAGRSDPSPSDPGYASALAYYEARAYGSGLLWDWSGRDDALDRYKELIHESDDRYRQATTAVGLVLLNHLLSATDGYLSASAGREARLRALPWDAGRGWGMGISVGLGR